jgi:hypothetical protein
MHAYSILSIPFYDARLQQYTKILSINAVPMGPLASRVKTVRPPRLSGLCGSGGGSGTGNACIHALVSCGGSGSGSGSGSCSTLCGPCNGFMTPQQLPELFAFLMSNGYTVDTALTKLAAKHQYGGGGCLPCATSNTNANSLVCIVSYGS